MWLFEWWAGLSPWFRFGLAGALLALSTVLLAFDLIWPWGWIGGVILLLLSIPWERKKDHYDW